MVSLINSKSFVKSDREFPAGYDGVFSPTLDIGKTFMSAVTDAKCEFTLLIPQCRNRWTMQSFDFCNKMCRYLSTKKLEY